MKRAANLRDGVGHDGLLLRLRLPLLMNTSFSVQRPFKHVAKVIADAKLLVQKGVDQIKVPWLMNDDVLL